MQRYFAAPVDPYILTNPFPQGFAGQFNNGIDNFSGICHRQTAGLTLKDATINPTKRTLILIVTGQSQWTNILPSYFAPTAPDAIENFNIYDGAIYDIQSRLLGCTVGPEPLGPGNIAVRLASKMTDNNKFDRVILITLSIGSTTMFMWGDPTGGLYNRVEIAMARLAARGITPTTPGTTWALIWALGEQDNVDGTSVGSMQASGASYFAKLASLGFNGRIFIPLESSPGETSNNVRTAQASFWNGTNIFSLGDTDTILDRDGIHYNDLGGSKIATLSYNQMHLTGSPF